VTRILVSASPGERRIAVIQDNTLTDYAIWRPGAPDGLGDVYLGRIIAKVPAMAGAFIALPGGEGFLPDSEGAAGRQEGELVPVRITRTAQGGKGPRLGAATHPPSDGPPRMLAPGPSKLHRLAALDTQAKILVDDPALFATLRTSFDGRLALVTAAFDDSLEAEIEALASPAADLPGGVRATISPTQALVAIDLDSAGATQAPSRKRAVQLAANRAAIPALVRQIRLRNLAGAILVDFAGMPIRQRAVLAPDLAAALADDPARPRLLGFTHLGLAEILRPRGAAPLHELLAGPHAAGLAALRRIALDLRVGPPRRLALRANPTVIAALQSDPAALPDLARRATHPLILRADPALPGCGWTIEDAA
jgi:hypothetical protein